MEVQDSSVNNTNKEAIFKNCAPFTNSKTELNNTQGKSGEYIDRVMSMFDLTEYGDAYSTISGSLW